MMINCTSPDTFKKSFNILKRNHYLDSATANLVPVEIAETIAYSLSNSLNTVGKGFYDLSFQSQALIDSTRQKLVRMVGSGNYHTLFTYNLAVTNELLSRSMDLSVFEGLTVLTSTHSSYLAYHKKFMARDIPVQFLGLSNDSSIDYTLFENFNTRNNLIILSPIVLGTGEILDLEKILSCFDPDLGNSYIIDASVSASHNLLDDVFKIDPSAVIIDPATSMFMPTGAAFTSVDPSAFHNYDQLITGDLSVNSATSDSIDYDKSLKSIEIPFIDTSKLSGLKACLDVVNRDFIVKNGKHCDRLSDKLVKAIIDLGFTVYGNSSSRSSNVVCFNYKDVNCHDIAMILDGCKVQIRSGLLCSHVVMDRLCVRKNNSGMCQASFHYYNNDKDVESLISGLDLVKKQFSN